MIIGEYSLIITEPEANKYTGDYFKKEEKKTFQCEIIFTYSGKMTTGSHFVRLANESVRFCIITCVFILKINNLKQSNIIEMADWGQVNVTGQQRGGMISKMCPCTA